MDMLEQIKRVGEAISKMSVEELREKLDKVSPEEAKEFAQLERWLLDE